MFFRSPVDKIMLHNKVPLVSHQCAGKFRTVFSLMFPALSSGLAECCSGCITGSEWITSDRFFADTKSLHIQLKKPIFKDYGK